MQVSNAFMRHKIFYKDIKNGNWIYVDYGRIFHGILFLVSFTGVDAGG
jgi:hypothetical protein